MKRVIIRHDGRYIHHGTGYTEHDGYSGTSDHKNRVSIKSLKAYYDERTEKPYQLEVNDKIAIVK